MTDLLSEEEITKVISRTKFMTGNFNWGERPTNSCFLQETWNLTDEQGATLPGLTVELRYRRGKIVEDCRYDFTVFLLYHNKRRRVYQLDVRPENVSGHTGINGIWYGPHQHFGERAEKLQYDSNMGCNDHENWFRLFLANANIQYGGKYSNPVVQMELI